MAFNAFMYSTLLNFCSVVNNVLNTENTTIKNTDRNVFLLGVNILVQGNRPQTNKKQMI